jgi:hypothetical protein
MNKHDWGLVNQKYMAIKEEQTDLMAEMKEDLDFYRKRIYQATKDFSKENTYPHAIKAAFIQYAQLLIEHFKLEDIKEIMSEQLETIEEEDVEEPEYIEKSADEITKQLLIDGEKKSPFIRIEDCFNVIKRPIAELEHIKRKPSRQPPQQQSINLRQDKFREKGVKKKILGQNKNSGEQNKNAHAIYGEDNKTSQKSVKQEEDTQVSQLFPAAKEQNP